jgi:hypothetical protein
MIAAKPSRMARAMVVTIKTNPLRPLLIFRLFGLFTALL